MSWELKHMAGIRKKIFLMLMTLDVWNKLEPLEFMLNKRKTLSTPKLVTWDQFLLWNSICLLINSPWISRADWIYSIKILGWTRSQKDHGFLSIFFLFRHFSHCFFCFHHSFNLFPFLFSLLFLFKVSFILFQLTRDPRMNMDFLVSLMFVFYVAE